MSMNPAVRSNTSIHSQNSTIDSHNTTDNSRHVTQNITIHNHVTIHPFGSEDPDSIHAMPGFQEKMENIIMMNGNHLPVVECVKLKHFNPDLPQYRNIAHKNTKKETVFVKRESSWKVESLRDLNDKLILGGIEMLAEFVTDSEIDLLVKYNMWGSVPVVNMPPELSQKCRIAGRPEPYPSFMLTDAMRRNRDTVSKRASREISMVIESQMYDEKRLPHGGHTGGVPCSIDRTRDDDDIV